MALDRVLQAMEPAKRLRLVILDACRENPFVKGMKRTVAGRSVGRGLARIEPTTGNTLIAFATKPSAIALDGKGSNSPFTSALVKHLVAPGLDLRIALGHVRDDVLASTDRKQEPYVTSSLGGGTISLVRGAPKAVTWPPPGQFSDAERTWAAVKDTTGIAVLEAFRLKHGAADRVYDSLAEERIKALRKQEQTVLATPSPAPTAFSPTRAVAPLTAAQERGLKPTDSFKECSGFFRESCGAPQAPLFRSTRDGPTVAEMSDNARRRPAVGPTTSSSRG